MSTKKNKLVKMLREIIKREVQKEVKKIFISEGMKVPSNKIVNDVPEVLPKPKNREEVSYTKNPMLNKVLNETAQQNEMEEYPTMGGGTFDSTKMAQAMGYGNVMGNPEDKRKLGAIQTAQAAGADTSNKAVQDVMSNLTKDYSGVMKALDKKDGKI
jgi:hypothetical protein|tara:strand:- start:64 stop:534 length:471 start_codon:yes stop_codon:yes gene_type:complete